MRVIQSFLYGLMLAASLVQPQIASSQSSTVSFEQVLDYALQASPLTKTLHAELASELSEGIAINTLANPELDLEVRPYVGGSNGNETEYEITLTQPLKASNFGSRQKVAALIKKSSSVEKALKLKEFEQTLLLAYGKAWALSEKERFTHAALDRAGKLSKQMHESYKKGVIQQSTERIFFAENKKLTLELNGIQGDRARALAELSRRTGISLKGRTLQSIKFKPLPAEVTIQSLDTIPLVERTRLRSDLAVAQERLARLDAYPDFAPHLAYEHTSDGDDRINVGISLELPFSERNQAEKLRHSATKLVRESEAAYINDGHLKNEIDLLLESVLATEKQVASFKSDVIPAITSALTAAELELNAGQGTNLLVWQLLRELNSAQDRYLELWIKALAERVELSVLTGESF